MAEISLVMKGVDAASGVIDGVAGAIGGLGAIAASVAAAGLAALGTGLAVSLSAAMDNEKIQASLEQTIKSTGGAAGLTAEAANALAQQFTNLAGGSDDLIIAIETVGLRAGTVSADEMPAFIQATLDLGTVMGDTTTAAELLARAQDDPEAAFKRIERATGAYDSALEEQIKTLVASGDNAGAVALIMDKLAETTGGAAQAQAETLSGKWEILKGTLGEAAEAIGGPLLTAGQALFDQFLAPAIPLITEFGTALGVALEVLLSGDIGGAFDALNEFDGVRAVFQGLGIDLSTVGTAVETFVEQAQTQAGNFIVAIQPIIDAAGNLLAAFQTNLPMMQQYFADMVSFVLAQVNTLSPTLIANISTTLNSLAEFWRAHGETIMQVVNAAFRIITVTIGGALTWLSGIIAATLQVINGDWTGAWETVKATFVTFMNSVLSIVGTDLETFTATWQTNWDMAVLIVTTVWQQIKDAVAEKVMEVTSGIQTAIIDSITWLQGLPATFTQIGTDLMNGLKSGVLSAAAGLIAAVTGAIGDAIAAAKALLGIASPSKLFAGIGENMMAGMAMGINSGASTAVAATQSATNAVSNSAVTTVNNWNLTAQYAPQSERSLRDDVRMLQMLSASA